MTIRAAAIGVSLATAFTIAALAAPQQPAAPAPQQPTFRGGVDVVNVSVTVTDKKGKSITDLTKDDFIVLEDKKPQDIVNFHSIKEVKTRAPIGVGLVLDISESMTRDKLDAMRTAVQLLLKRLLPADEVYFIEFATEPRLVEPWTTDRNKILDAIRRVKNRPGTAVYNAIMSGLEISAKAKDKKQVILVITDGGDSNSTVKRQTVADAARASDVLVYALLLDEEEQIGTRGGRSGGGGLEGPRTGNGGNGGTASSADLRQAALELAQVTDATGGRARYVQGFAQLEDGITQLGTEFTAQYELSFARGIADGKYHEIAVNVRKPDVVVRHRRGYVAN